MEQMQTYDIHNYSTISVFSNDFLSRIFFSLAYFTIRTQYIKYVVNNRPINN